VNLQVRPEPSDDERRAILAALAADEAEPEDSPWAAAALPGRDDEP